MAAHLQDWPTPPHERLGAPVPEVLEKLIMDCLDKDPANRPQSARALREALDAAAKRDGDALVRGSLPKKG